MWARIWPDTPELADRRGKDLDEALARDPGSPEVRYRRAIFLARQGRPDDADRELDAALAARPDEPRYLLARLAVHDRRLLARKAHLAPAPAEVVAHLARTATSAWQLYGVASNQRRAHQNEEASRTIQRALAINPPCWECESVRAALLADAGRRDEALAAVDRALALLPDGSSSADLLALRREIASQPRPPDRH